MTTKMIGSTIILSEEEVDHGRIIAKGRTKVNRGGNVPDKRIHPVSDELANDEGVYSEIAFCKLFNLYPRVFDLAPRSSCKNTDDGDATMHDGRIVDVKTTTRENGRLLACHWKAKSCVVDVFALVTGKCPKYIFRGFLSAHDLFLDSRKRQMRAGAPMAYVADQNELKEYDEISFINKISPGVKRIIDKFEENETSKKSKDEFTFF
jgi:hypothetical protein